MKRPLSSQDGFTFIEIMIALIILATAVSTLLGMQGAAIARTVRDKDAQQAMLLARRIMASIEAMPQGKNLDTFEDKPALAALQQFGIPDPPDEASKQALSPFKISLGMGDLTLPLPNVEEEPLTKINLQISWGAQPDEMFSVTYLIPR